MKLKDILNEKITIDVEVGDTILTGRFKNKKTKVNSIETDQHGMPTINGRKVTTFRTLKKQNENKEEIKVLHNFLTKYTKSSKKAAAMIKKNYKRVVKQFRGDSTRDLAMALIGYDMIGENKDLFKMYTQAMKMMPGSPKQKELIKKISSLRKKLKMDEGPQRDRNDMALYIIDLNKELSNAKVLAKKHPKYKKYIKFIQQDIKDAEKKLAKMKESVMDEAKAKRDYKDEYKKFQSSKKSKKYRAELNKYNRKKGTYGNGDGKDASHKGGKIVGFESQSKNRGRREKSRLKKK